MIVIVVTEAKSSARAGIAATIINGTTLDLLGSKLRQIAMPLMMRIARPGSSSLFIGNTKK